MLKNPGAGHKFDSYGKPVVFSWESHPLVEKFGLHVGRWPWKDLFSSGTYNYIVHNCDSFSCWQFEAADPDTVFPGLSGTSTGSLEPQKTSEGRYCWQVWPQYPEDYSQPLVETYQTLCYTSGPARPKWSPDVPEAEYPFDKPVTLHAFFAYVPDAQFAFSTDHPSLVKLEHSCTSDGYVYVDVYDCDVTVTIEPSVGETVTIWADAFASQKGEMDEASRVWHEPISIKFKSCGHMKEPCCEPNDSCIQTPGHMLIACDPSTKTCQRCSLQDDICCHYAVGDCQQPWLTCEQSSNRCRRCGDSGEMCCVMREGDEPYCKEGYTCKNGVCGCGQEGANCHNGDECCGKKCAAVRWLSFPDSQCANCGYHDFNPADDGAVGWLPCCLVHVGTPASDVHTCNSDIDQCLVMQGTISAGGPAYTGCIRRREDGTYACGKSIDPIASLCCRLNSWAQTDGVCVDGQKCVNYYCEGL
jgi:hypothetical protein